MSYEKPLNLPLNEIANQKYSLTPMELFLLVYRKKKAETFKHILKALQMNYLTNCQILQISPNKG